MTDTVVLDLQEGFHRDEIVVSAADRELTREADVSTRVQLGHARSVPLDLAGDPCEVTVSVPGLGLEETVQVPAERPLWIRASLSVDRDRLDVQVVQEAPRYM